MEHEATTATRLHNRGFNVHRLKKAWSGGVGAAAAIAGLVSFVAVVQPAEAAEEVTDVVCTKRFVVRQDGASLRLPYCANASLTDGDSSLERAIVVVHGHSRRSENEYESVAAAARRVDADTRASTAIIAPQFLLKEDLDRYRLAEDTLFWGTNEWKYGDASSDTSDHRRPFTIGSFEVMDRILEQLADERAFPNLTEIIVAGHSAGGQFANRYAAGGRAMERIGRTRSDLGFRFVVSNPSSYLYFSPERAIAGTRNTFYVPEFRGCPASNRYQYGLDELNPYLAEAGAAAITRQYQSQRVMLLLGGRDVDRDDSQLASGCAAMLQGPHRLDRGRIYFNHLKRFFGDTNLARHRLDVVPGAAHNPWDMYRSDCGLAHLFDYDPDRSCSDDVDDDIDRGGGQPPPDSDTLAVGLTPSAVGHTWYTVDFAASDLSDTPRLLAAMQTFNGEDTASLRIRNVDGGGFEVFVEEGTSIDDEIVHAAEVVGYAAFDPGTIVDRDGEVIGEAGSVQHTQDGPAEWRTITPANRYVDPVVVINIVTFNGIAPGHTRVRDVTDRSFQWQIEEWHYQDGAKPTEMINYAVFESGVHDLPDGRIMEAGNVRADHQWTSVGFRAGFASEPVLLSQGQTRNGTSPVVTRHRRVTVNGAELMLQEEEGRDGVHLVENLGYVAIER